MFRVLSTTNSPPSYEEYVIFRRKGQLESKVIDQDGDTILQLHYGYHPLRMKVIRWIVRHEVVALYFDINLEKEFIVGDIYDPPVWIEDFDITLTHLFNLMHAPVKYEKAAFDTFVGAQTPRSWYALAKLVKEVGRTHERLLRWVRNGLMESFSNHYLSVFDKFDEGAFKEYPNRAMHGRAEELLRLGAAARMLGVAKTADEAARMLHDFLTYEEVRIEDDDLPVDTSFDRWTDKWGDPDESGVVNVHYDVAGTVNYVPPSQMEMEIGQFSSMFFVNLCKTPSTRSILTFAYGEANPADTNELEEQGDIQIKTIGLLRQVFGSLLACIRYGYTKDTKMNQGSENNLYLAERGLVDFAMLRKTTLIPAPLACPDCRSMRYRDIHRDVEELMGITLSFDYKRKWRRLSVNPKTQQQSRPNASSERSQDHDTATKFIVKLSKRFGQPATVWDFVSALEDLTKRIGERRKREIRMECSPFSHLASFLRGVMWSRPTEQTRDGEDNTPDFGQMTRARDEDEETHDQPHVGQIPGLQEEPTASTSINSSIPGTSKVSYNDQRPYEDSSRKRARLQDLVELRDPLLKHARHRCQNRKRRDDDCSDVSERGAHVVIRRCYSEPLPVFEPAILRREMPVRLASSGYF